MNQLYLFALQEFFLLIAVVYLQDVIFLDWLHPNVFLPLNVDLDDDDDYLSKQHLLHLHLIQQQVQ
jgi:hypothetical protein